MREIDEPLTDPSFPPEVGAPPVTNDVHEKFFRLSAINTMKLCVPDDPQLDWLIKCLEKGNAVCRMRTVTNFTDPVPFYVKECQVCGSPHVLVLVKWDAERREFVGKCNKTAGEVVLTPDPDFCLNDDRKAKPKVEDPETHEGTSIYSDTCQCRWCKQARHEINKPPSGRID